MDIKPYDEERDLRAVQRIWREVGWVESPEEASYIKDLFGVGSCLTGRLGDSAECAVHTVPGTVRYLDRPMRMCAVTAVTTSRIARKQHFAQKLTALQLAEAAVNGAQVAMLGIFDQGFYDKVGFGTGSYESTFKFDPASLKVDVPFRIPSRIHKDDWPAVHQALLNRLVDHGGCTLDPPETVKCEMGWTENGFGLGYYEGETLTHFFWAEMKGENGPCEIAAIAYRNKDEFLELLALIRSLADQISSVRMHEPPGVQLQALLSQPFRHRRNTRGSEHDNHHRSVAYWQLRLLDIPKCVEYRRWMGEPVEFNLRLSDPVSALLEGQDWSGVGGDYSVRIGPDSEASPGFSQGLPQLDASVNAFSRLFFGIASASELTVSDDFAAPDSLLAQLNEAFCLPRPSTSWDF